MFSLEELLNNLEYVTFFVRLNGKPKLWLEKIAKKDPQSWSNRKLLHIYNIYTAQTDFVDSFYRLLQIKFFRDGPFIKKRYK